MFPRIIKQKFAIAWENRLEIVQSLWQKPLRSVAVQMAIQMQLNVVNESNSLIAIQSLMNKSKVSSQITNLIKHITTIMQLGLFIFSTIIR